MLHWEVMLGIVAMAPVKHDRRGHAHERRVAVGVLPRSAEAAANYAVRMAFGLGLIDRGLDQYQIPRFGSPKEKAELDLVGGGMTAEAAAPAGAKSAFPGEDVMQTAAVMAARASAQNPLDADAIARTFRQGKKVSHKIAAVLAALARVGYVTTTDNGRSFALRRAA